VPLKVTENGAVYVRDIGEVSDGSDLTTSIAIVNGKRTVYMPVTKRSDASTLSVVELVKANIPKFKAACPEDINVTFEFDQSPWIIRAIEDLVKEGLLGAALTGLMVLIFLRDLRSAFIVILNIPVALAASLLALWITGSTVNLMTLGGLALAVGILVDEATVEIENIHRRMKQSGAGNHRPAQPLDALHPRRVCAEFFYDRSREGPVPAAFARRGLFDDRFVSALQHARAHFEHLVASGASSDESD
jgi:multidrug efflux pump subunit AcrB